MRIAKSLAIITLAPIVASCTAYVHDRPAHRPAPCARAARPGGEPRLGVIGISIGRAEESRRGPIVVERVVTSSPAGDANIRPGDRIRAIDGESTRGMTVSEAARLIRGRAETSVELRVDSPRGNRLVTLVRVPPHAIWGERGHCRKSARRCDEGGRYSRVAPAPPDEELDDSPPTEIWPPTKPGHSL